MATDDCYDDPLSMPLPAGSHRTQCVVRDVPERAEPARLVLSQMGDQLAEWQL